MSMVAFALDSGPKTRVLTFNEAERLSDFLSAMLVHWSKQTGIQVTGEASLDVVRVSVLTVGLMARSAGAAPDDIVQATYETTALVATAERLHIVREGGEA